MRSRKRGALAGQAGSVEVGPGVEQELVEADRELALRDHRPVGPPVGIGHHRAHETAILALDAEEVDPHPRRRHPAPGIQNVRRHVALGHRLLPRCRRHPRRTPAALTRRSTLKNLRGEFESRRPPAGLDGGAGGERCMRYPRNMQGYGGRPPFADWPGGANVAVQFVLNYEEGGENSLLHGDAASEGFLSEIPGAQPWPGQRHWNMESVYEYGARAGFWRLRDLFVSRGVPRHHLRRRHRPRPLARPGRGDAGGRLGDRHPRPDAGSTTATTPARPRRPDMRRGDPPPHRGRRRAAARLVHRPDLDPHRRARLPRPGSSTRSPTPTTTTFPTGSSTPAASSSSSPTASRPTTCGSRRGRSPPRRTSSPTSRTPSTSSTPRARRARRRCSPSASTAASSAGRAASPGSRASSTTS